MRPVLKFLSDQDIQNIHGLALDMLENLGMKLCNQEACDYFKKAGASVDGFVVKIPRKLIEDTLATVPKHDDFVLYGRTPNRDVHLKGAMPSLHAMTMAIKVRDPLTGEVRAATNDDHAKLTRILEQMDTVTSASALVTPQDVPLHEADWYTWATSIKNTTKHITGGCVGKQGVRDAMRMASLAIGSEEEFLKRPFISVWALTSPPLAAQENMCNTLMEAARLGITNVISSGGILGMSSPITCESALIHTHAELLACIALTQLVRPGAPVIYSSFLRSVDMRTMCVGMGSPESDLMRGCMAQMGAYINLPTEVPCMLRDGKVVDAQTGFETGMGGFIGSMTADFVVCMQLDSDLLVDYADLPFTNECMRQILRVMRPLDFDEERVCLENIEEVGHGGSFLDSYHTAEFFRDELWTADLVERENYDKWKQDGAKDIRQKCLERAMEILQKSSNQPLLPPDICAQIDKIAENSKA